MTFLQEVLEYNDKLRSRGMTVTIGPEHGTGDQMHFIYTFGKDQHEMIISFEPTDYTAWNGLMEWVEKHIV